MKTLLTRIWGVVLILFGLGVLGWIAYLRYVDKDPAHQPDRPGFIIALSIAALILGVIRLRGTRRPPTE